MKALLLSAVLLLALPLAAEPPLSLEEARAYVAQYPEEAAVDIVKLDALERARPVVEMPRGILIETGSQVAWTWAGPLQVSISGGALDYTIALPTAAVRRLAAPWWPIPAAAAGGVLAGLVVGLLVN